MGTYKEVAPEQLELRVCLFYQEKSLIGLQGEESTWLETKYKQERYRNFWKVFAFVISHPGMSGPKPPRERLWQLYFQEALLKSAQEV